MLNDKDPGKKKFEPWIVYFKHLNRPQSLSNSDGPRWRKLRSAINPILSRPQAVVKHINDHNKIADDMIESIKRDIGNKDSAIYEQFDKKLKFLALECKLLMLNLNKYD